MCNSWKLWGSRSFYFLFCFLYIVAAETLVDKAMEIDHFGGTFGGNRKATPFMCLILKMLQIQPEKEIVVEFIKNDDYKWVDNENIHLLHRLRAFDVIFCFVCEHLMSSHCYGFILTYSIGLAYDQIIDYRCSVFFLLHWFLFERLNLLTVFVDGRAR